MSSEARRQREGAVVHAADAAFLASLSTEKLKAWADEIHWTIAAAQSSDDPDASEGLQAACEANFKTLNEIQAEIGKRGAKK